MIVHLGNETYHWFIYYSLFLVGWADDCELQLFLVGWGETWKRYDKDVLHVIRPSHCSRRRRLQPTWSVLVQPSAAVKRQHSGVGHCNCFNNFWRSETEERDIQFSSITQWVFHSVFMNIYIYMHIYISIVYIISHVFEYICYIQGYTGLSCLFIWVRLNPLVGIPIERAAMDYIWAIYNDFSRGHPRWWFRKGIPPKMALN